MIVLGCWTKEGIFCVNLKDEGCPHAGKYDGLDDTFDCKLSEWTSQRLNVH